MFLSTPPSRVATLIVHFLSTPFSVSIHATLAGGDEGEHRISMSRYLFLSTPPSRVATVGWAIAHPFTLCFYPRHPRGWRQPPEAGTAEAGEFLSTPPSRVATRVHLAALRQCVRFYPRHPRGWRPRTTFCILAHPFRFYPRHPRGWRPLVHGRQGRALRVSIHATLAGGDALCTFRSAGRAQVSIHATLAGGDL